VHRLNPYDNFLRRAIRSVFTPLVLLRGATRSALASALPAVESAGEAARAGTRGLIFTSGWTFGAIITAAMVIAWGAEAAQFFISRGMALAVLAWLQTLPEFAVEAQIAYTAGRNPEYLHFVTANFTGSLRLFVGFGWPMIYFVHAFFNRKRNKGLPEIRMGGDDAATIFFLYPALAYFTVIWWKGTLTIADGIILIAIYMSYLALLQFLPPQELEDDQELGLVPRTIVHMPRGLRIASILLLFAVGGSVLWLCAKPFLETLQGLALAVGVPAFVFIQWVAPFVSEFPEKVSAFYWARTPKKAPMAFMNMVNSSFSQWTLLTGLIPFVYCWSAGRVAPVVFDGHQRTEILLTIVQSLLGAMLLSNLVFRCWEAVVLFVLWFAQLIVPGIREEILWVYAGWVILEAANLIRDRKHFAVFPAFFSLVRRHVLKRT